MDEKRVVDFFRENGADLVGFGDLTELEPEVRRSLPVGISVAIRYPRDVIRGIHDMPTPEYRRYYDSINVALDKLVTMGEAMLRGLGYQAFAQTRDAVGSWEPRLGTTLPHKTVATRAGLGWIGKSALLVTETYGSAIRLSSLLTDAPLPVSEPVNESRCGGCRICLEHCPAGAVKGANWAKGMARQDYFDAAACREEARARSKQVFGEDVTICGRCIEICPHTRRYLSQPND